jgi:hypothetical protein
MGFSVTYHNAFGADSDQRLSHAVPKKKKPWCLMQRIKDAITLLHINLNSIYLKYFVPILFKNIIFASTPNHRLICKFLMVFK